MGELRFTWDPRKASANLKKHRVAFEDAQTVFFDEHALQLDDPDDSVGEDRFLLLGLSSGLRLLVVCHCERADGDEIRLISARRADRTEQREYWGRLER